MNKLDTGIYKALNAHTDSKNVSIVNLSSVQDNLLMTKVMTGMAIDRQNKYEEARNEAHKYCCILNPTNSDNDYKKRGFAQL